MEDVPNRIEHTVLGPKTGWEAVAETLDGALLHGMRACIPPWAVARANKYTPTVPLTTVIGFPHGQHTTRTKCAEATEAWNAGADEIDVVGNLGALGSDGDEFETELAEIVAAVPIPVSVIVEAPVLNDRQLRQACEAVADADAAFLKTATGFNGGGATVADVELMSQYLPVKASGGIDSWAFADELFAAGAVRIGTAHGELLLDEFER